jgi:hypothetical protein
VHSFPLESQKFQIIFLQYLLNIFHYFIAEGKNTMYFSCNGSLGKPIGVNYYGFLFSYPPPPPFFFHFLSTGSAWLVGLYSFTQLNTLLIATTIEEATFSAVFECCFVRALL